MAIRYTGSFARKAFGYDAELARQIVFNQSPTAASVLPRLSNLANHSKFWMGSAALIALGGGRNGRRSAQRGVLAIAASSAIANGVLKPLLPRERPPVPDGALPSIVRRPKSSSFPSGHAAAASAFAVGASIESPILALPLAVLACSVGYSRITTGVHYPSDVLAGATLGAAVALGTTKVFPLIDKSSAKAKKVQHRRLVAEPSTSGEGLTIVVNASAGSAAHEEDLEEIESALEGVKVELVDSPDELSEAFRAAAAESKALGVLGGDGTVGAAATAALAADIPLVVFPGGTLNHFARDLGLETVADAIRAFRNGHLVEVDAASIDGRIFMNTASFGAYSDFVETRESYEDRIGKWPAAAFALARLLVSGARFDVTIDGEQLSIWMIFIGNCKYHPDGFVPAGRSRFDDGLLDVRIVDGSEKFSRTRLMWALLTGQLDRSPVYTQRLAKSIEVTMPAGAQVLAADGETFEGSDSFVVDKADRPLRTYSPGDDANG